MKPIDELVTTIGIDGEPALRQLDELNKLLSMANVMARRLKKSLSELKIKVDTK